MKSDAILLIAADTRVRYVRLGPKGCWEHKAIEKGALLIDFDTGSPETYWMCRDARRVELAKYCTTFQVEGRWWTCQPSFLAIKMPAKTLTPNQNL